VLGLLEAKGAEFDALWVMGMNDQHWPPPARQNPLLSAELQRRQRTPGSSAEVQTEFAHGIHERLLHSAPEITFSYAEKEGERELRPSPLLTDLLGTEGSPDLTLASDVFRRVELGGHDENKFEMLDDHQAPPLADGEKVSGGSGLLRAQAICPAWAFYRYRLGAKKLETPTEGFDASRRGTMVHAMLEVFWEGVKDSVCLDELNGTQLQEKVAAAAEYALSQFETTQNEKLPTTFRQLEANRLQRLCLEWLAVERFDPSKPSPRQPFRVIACEEKHTVSLGQLRINLVIDRIDELIEDGRRIVLDYKTGSTVDTKTWFGDRRITEPQLPLYAAIVLAKADEPPVAAVAFAKVRLRECKFEGIAADGDLLLGVPGRRQPPPAMDEEEAGDGTVEDAEAPHESVKASTEINQEAEVLVDEWQDLLDSWKARLEAIAEEIRSGEAAVWFEDEKSLAYCEVLPLLRLTERKIQFEKCQEVQS
jgi:exodeoxyribonuclease-5